jgi:hypothetical protein
LSFKRVVGAEENHMKAAAPTGNPAFMSKINDNRIAIRQGTYKGKEL